jgi:SNF family Na+-dependent transporter
MLFFLGVDGEFATTEVAATFIKDTGRRLLPGTAPVSDPVISLALCLVAFLLGLPMVTDAGFYWFAVFASWPDRFVVYTVCGMECLAISQLYPGGVEKFSKEVEAMIGRPVPKYYQYHLHVTMITIRTVD